MTFSYEDERPKITLRVSEELKEELAKKPNQSAYIRESLRDRLELEGENSDLLDLPDDDHLAVMYQLADRMAGRRGRVTKEALITATAQNVGMGSAVCESYLRKLVNRGYLTVHPGMQTVKIGVVHDV